MNPRTWLALGGAVLAAAVIVRLVRTRAQRSAAGRRFFSHPAVAAALGVLAFVATIALAAPLVAPFAPNAQLDIVGLKNHAPSWRYVLGTDVYSRDVWSRLVFGARVSLAIGTIAALLAVTVGTLVGAASGYWHRLDAWLMRGVDVGLAFPRIFLFLMVVAVLGPPSVGSLIILIGVTSWFATSRLVRAEVLALAQRPFIDAVQALGARPVRVIMRHVLPNVAAPIIVSAALGVGHVMLLEAGLSFLGVGVAPPAPSWGNMIADGTGALTTAPWCTLAPGLAIALVVTALNAVGDALRDALDPRLTT